MDMGVATELGYQFFVAARGLMMAAGLKWNTIVCASVRECHPTPPRGHSSSWSAVAVAYRGRPVAPGEAPGSPRTDTQPESSTARPRSPVPGEVHINEPGERKRASGATRPSHPLQRPLERLPRVPLRDEAAALHPSRAVPTCPIPVPPKRGPAWSIRLHREADPAAPRHTSSIDNEIEESQPRRAWIG